MGSPYRKLFNLFAVSLLAFAIYLNFIHKDEDESSANVATKTSATYVQAAAQQPKQPVAVENAKPAVKEEKRN
jgi:hypothetical protein